MSYKFINMYLGSSFLNFLMKFIFVITTPHLYKMEGGDNKNKSLIFLVKNYYLNSIYYFYHSI